MRQHYRRRYPEQRISESEDVVIRSVWSLYLEDIQDIHDVLSDIADPSTVEELAEKQKRDIENYARRMHQKYGDDPRALEQLGLEKGRLTEQTPATSLVKVEADDRPDLTIETLTELPRSYARELKLAIRNPMMWVSCTGNSYLVHALSPDNTTREATRRIVHVMQARRSKLLALLSSTRELMIGSLLLVILGIPLGLIFPDSWIPPVVVWLGAVGFIGSSMFPVQYERRKPVVVLRNEKDAPGFWMRNQDGLFVAAFGVILAAIVGALVAAIKGWI